MLVEAIASSDERSEPAITHNRHADQAVKALHQDVVRNLGWAPLVGDKQS